MIFLGLKIDWAEGWANNPSIDFLVDKMPSGDDFVFEAIPTGGGEVYYWAIADGVLKSYAHDPRNERGFGGSVFHLRMADGTYRDIKGPWDAGSGTANKILRQSFVSVGLTDRPNYTCWGTEVAYLDVQEALWSFDDRLTLTDSSIKTTGLSDEQSLVVAGRSSKADSFIWVLSKDLKDKVGSVLTKNGSNWGLFDKYESYFGEWKPK